MSTEKRIAEILVEWEILTENVRIVFSKRVQMTIFM